MQRWIKEQKAFISIFTNQLPLYEVVLIWNLKAYYQCKQKLCKEMLTNGSDEILIFSS